MGETGEEVHSAAYPVRTGETRQGGRGERIPGFGWQLDQEIPSGIEGAVFDLVARGLGAEADLLRAYNQAAEPFRRIRPAQRASGPFASQLDQPTGGASITGWPQ